jgi:hypothetical protein
VNLADFEPGNVVAVTLGRPDATLEFTRARSNAGWAMTNPVKDRASDGAVNRLLAALAGADIARDLGPQKDLSPYGLAEPAARITAVTARGDTAVDLDVGGLTVEKYHAYAKRHGAGTGILLIPTDIRRYALDVPNAYRSRRLTDFDLASVRRFTVSWPDSEVTWTRNQRGEWSTTVDGHAIRGRQTDVEAQIRRVRGLRVAEFVPPDQVAVVKPFDAPPRSFRVTLADGSEQRVKIGRQLDSRVYATSRLPASGGERVVLTDTTALELFAKSTADLRDRRLLSCDLDELGKLELVSPAANVTLVRRGNDWGFPNPALEPPGPLQVRRAIVGVFDLQYRRVLDESPGDAPSNGLSNADIRLTIYNRSGERIDRLLCTRNGAEPGTYVATSGYAAVVAEIDAGDLDAVIANLKNLR